MANSTENLTAERWLLGACLQNAALISEASQIVQPTDFTDPKHVRIFEAMLRLDAPTEARPVFHSGMRMALGDDLEEIGGMLYLADLSHAPSSTDGWRTDAEAVRDSAHRRRLLQICDEAGHIARSDAGLPEILDKMRSRLMDLDPPSNAVISVRDAMKSALSEIDAVARGELPSNLEVGIESIDFHTGGIGRDDLVVLAGRTSHGKTTLALNAVANIAKTGGHVLIFSLETSAQNLTLSLQCQQSGVSRYRLSQGRLTESESRRFAHATTDVANLPIDISAKTSVGVADIEAISLGVNRRSPLSLIVIDYLQLLRVNRRENRNLEIGEAVRQLKSFTLAYQIPILLLSQLRRGDLMGRERPPRLEDLRDSGEIENHASQVWAIHRPRKGMSEDERAALASEGKASDDNYAMFMVLKSKVMPTSEVPVAWNPDFMRYETKPVERESVQF